MKRDIELLAPGGDIDSIKAAIAAGADAIYFGLHKFNARNRATNIDSEYLNGIIHLAHKNNCKVFLTLNIIIVESEIPALIGLLNTLVNTKIDGIIVQDLGLLYILSKYFTGLSIHGSTQLTTHNKGQIQFLIKLQVSRVNLSRELNICEIEELSECAHEKNILTEVFVHGSYCISFSGLCYMSSILGGKSGNRGRCSQPCRDQYLKTSVGKDFPLNLKDNSAFFDLEKLYDAGVDSIKIEGRVKKLDYVYTVVSCWRKHIQNFNRNTIINNANNANSDLYKVFNRDFSNGYLIGKINKDLFIDNPRDHTIKQFAGIDHSSGNKLLLKEKNEYYESKSTISAEVKKKIQELNIEKLPLTVEISGHLGTPLQVAVKTQDTSFVVMSETNLVYAGSYASELVHGKQTDENGEKISVDDNCIKSIKEGTVRALNDDVFLERFKAINNTEFYLSHLSLDNLQKDLFIPFKELTSIKNRILCTLNGAQKIIDPIHIPSLKKSDILQNKPDLAVLISSQEDVDLCRKTSAKIFFQLPNCFSTEYSDFIDLFSKNKNLFPWFPSLLIGADYSAAVDILRQVQPRMIVTNNSGIGFEAYRQGIPWVAGPHLNIVNSFSLLCLKEKFNCSGSFISNEINKKQIRNIVRPEQFSLYYSLYHPILLMTSRQCLFYQTIGCDKETMSEDCMLNCSRDASITDLDMVSFPLRKNKGEYHCMYNNLNFLNTEVVTDLPHLFSNFFIDLRDIKTGTEISVSKQQITEMFLHFVSGNYHLANNIKMAITPSTKSQYTVGI